LNGNGVFVKLGEKWFDDYWINYGKIQFAAPDGRVKKITSLRDYLAYRGKNAKLANTIVRKPGRRISRRRTK
jgi:hypothetical protein